MTLNLKDVDHLDAGALQILLVLKIEQKKRGRQLDLIDVSPHLRRWFDHAGAVDRFFIAEKNDE